MWEREKVRKRKEWMFTSFYCAWNIPCDHLHEQPWAKFIIGADHWHQWHYLYIKDIHIVVGLILAFLRRARPRADFYKRGLKNSKEETFSNQKEGVVFCVGSSWEPGDWNGELLLQLVRQVFYLSRNSLRRMAATESLMWSLNKENKVKDKEGGKEEKLCSGSWSKRIWCSVILWPHEDSTVWRGGFFFHLHMFFFSCGCFFVGGAFFLGYIFRLVIIPLMPLLISLHYGQADKFQVA